MWWELIIIEIADSHDYQDDDMKGINPFLVTLPNYDTERLFKRMACFPNPSERERNLPSHLRVHCVEKLREWAYPWSAHKDLAKMILRIINIGYSHRNPLTPEYIVKTRMENLLDYNTSLKIVPTIGVSLIGISGTGKSVAVEKILSNYYPQVIKHSEDREKNLLIDQLVWLKVDCLYNPTAKTVCLEILDKIDQILDTPYFPLFKHEKEDEIMMQVAKILWLHGVGLLVIDEIQELVTAGNKAKLALQGFLEKMCCVIGIPILLIGNPLACSVLPDTFRSNFLRWDRLKYDVEWGKLMRNLFRYQWTSEQAENTSYISRMLYESSLGVVDVAIKVYISAQQYCINLGIRSLTPDIITLVSREKYRLIQPMLYALQKGIESDLKQYPDLVF